MPGVVVVQAVLQPLAELGFALGGIMEISHEAFDQPFGFGRRYFALGQFLQPGVRSFEHANLAANLLVGHRPAAPADHQEILKFWAQQGF